MRKAILLGGTTFALAAASAAHADPLLGLYVGAGAIQSNVGNVLNTGSDISDQEYKLFAGVQPAGSPVGFEAEYLDFGSQINSFSKVKADAWNYSALAHVPLPLPFLSIYGKAGIAQDDVRGFFAEGGRLVTRDAQATQFTFGGGFQVTAGNVAARLEYQHFPLINTDGANVFSLGIQFTFL